VSGARPSRGDNIDELGLLDFTLFQLLLHLNVLRSVLKAVECHLGLSNLNDALLVLRGLTLAQSTSLHWHDRATLLKFFNILRGPLGRVLSVGNLWHAHAFSLCAALLQSSVVHLLVKRRMVATLGVDVMREQVLTIVDATDNRLDVAFAVSMEGWFAEVGGEGGVRKPSCGVVELRATFIHFGGFFFLCCCESFLWFEGLGCALRLNVLLDFHKLFRVV